MFVGRHAIEVGWGDCDPARIVFFPRYFEWFEICTTAMFRNAGLPLHAMFAERNMVGIPLLDVGARFHFGSGYGHVLEVESRVVEWKAKTFRVEHRFFRDGGLAVEGHEVAGLGRARSDGREADAGGADPARCRRTVHGPKGGERMTAPIRRPPSDLPHLAIEERGALAIVRLDRAAKRRRRRTTP